MILLKEIWVKLKGALDHHWFYDVRFFLLLCFFILFSISWPQMLECHLVCYTVCSCVIASMTCSKVCPLPKRPGCTESNFFTYCTKNRECNWNDIQVRNLPLEDHDEGKIMNELRKTTTTTTIILEDKTGFRPCLKWLLKPSSSPPSQLVNVIKAWRV